MLIYKSNFHLAYCQIPAQISLTSAGHGKSKVSSFGKGEIQCHRVIVPEQTVPTQPLLLSTQTLTMYFDGQHLGGVVWRGHIFGVRHTAVGPLIELSYTGDGQD